MEGQRLCKHKGGCVHNTLYGLVKAMLQGFVIKSAVHLLLSVLLRKGYKQPLKCLAGFFSLDALRFSSFVGLFSALYKATLCLMRNFRSKDDGVNYLVAGLVSGLSLLAEDKNRRETWSLYFTARLVDVVLRSASKRTGGWDVVKTEFYMFMFMIYFIVWSYGCEKDNLPKSYFGFINTLTNPSVNERKIMDEWCRMSALKHPLKN